MGLAGRRRVILYERVCFSVPIAVYLLSLMAHLSAHACVHVWMHSTGWRVGSCLWLPPEQGRSFCLLRWNSRLLILPNLWMFHARVQQDWADLWTGYRWAKQTFAFCTSGWEDEVGAEWLFSFESTEADLGACLSFPFHRNPTGPRLTLLWFPAWVLTSLVIRGIWLLPSAQPRSWRSMT